MEKNAFLETSNAETVTISRAEYEELQELKKQNEWLLEQLRVIKSKLFDSSSEKASEEVIGQLSLLFNEPEVLVEEEKASEEPVVEVRAHTRQRKSGRSPQISSFSDGDELWFITAWPRPAGASAKRNSPSGASRRLPGDGVYSTGIRSRSALFLIPYGMNSEPDTSTSSTAIPAYHR